MLKVHAISDVVAAAETIRTGWVHTAAWAKGTAAAAEAAGVAGTASSAVHTHAEEAGTMSTTASAQIHGAVAGYTPLAGAEAAVAERTVPVAGIIAANEAEVAPVRVAGIYSGAAGSIAAVDAARIGVLPEMCLVEDV